MRALVIKNSMNGGEISPFVLARTDLAKYPNSLERCENFIPLITGGITRRPGTRFILPALGPSRLLPFEFSTTQTFALEFGNQQLRFFTIVAGVAGVILSGGIPYVISTPYDTGADDLWDLKVTQQGDVMYITHPNHPPMKLSRVTDTNWRLTQPAFQSPPTHAFDQDVSNATITLTPGATSGNGVVFTASAQVFIQGDIGKRIISGIGSAVITALGGSFSTDPNTGAELFPQAACDISNPFASTAAIAAGAWFLRGAPQGYLEYANHNGADPTKVHLERKLGAGQTLDVFTFAHYLADGQPFPSDNDQACFREIDVGRYLVAGGAVGLIVSLIDASHIMVRRYSPIEDTTVAAVNADVVAAPQSGGTWTVEDPAFSAANGYPACCTFMQDRLIFAGTSAIPLGVWGSRTGDYENFAKAPQDADGLDFGVNARIQQPIRSLEEYRGNLGVFTAREEYMVGGGVISVSNASPQALTPGNVTPVRQSKNGSSRVQPQVIQNMLLYTWRSKLAASEMQYNIYQANFGSRNLNILHELITASGIKEAAWQQFPYYVNWYTTESTPGGSGSGVITNKLPVSIPTQPTVGFAFTGDSTIGGTPVLPLTITRPIPVGAAVGDIILAKISVKGIFPGVGATINPIATPAGWNLLAPFHLGQGQIGTNLFYRVVDGTEGANMTFSYLGPAYNFNGFQINAALILIRNANTAAPLDSIAYTNHATPGPASSTDSLTPNQDNTLLLIFMEPVNPDANQGGAGQITPGDIPGTTPQFNTKSGAGALTDTAACWSMPQAVAAATGVFTSPSGWPLTEAEQIVIAIAPNPNPTTVTTKAAGQLIGLTYEVEQQVWGWHRHFSGQDLAVVDNWVSVCSVQDPGDEQSDRLWAVTQRQVNGQTVYSIEIFDPALNTDCASVLTSMSKVTIVSGLGYLAGRTVQLKADGMYLGKFIVPSNGVVDFSAQIPGGALNVEAGLPNISYALTVRPEIGQGGQTIQGVKKGWSRVWARVYNSINIRLGAGIGDAKTTLTRLLGRRPSDPLGVAVAPFTGDVALEGNLGSDFDGRIVVEQDQPFPLTVLAPFGILTIGEQ